MSQAGYKGFLLDIDGTLYDYDKAHNEALAAALAWVARASGMREEALKDAYKDARLSINAELSGTASSHNRLLYFQRVFESIGMNPLTHALGAYEAYWDTFIDGISLYEDARLFLARLSECKVCLVTDLTAHIQYRKVRRLGLDRYAGFMVTSEEAGRDKPDPRIFRLALEKMQLRADDVCMIGDSLDKDIAGAEAVGIRGFWMNRKADDGGGDPPAKAVSSFHELLEYIP